MNILNVWEADLNLTEGHNRPVELSLDQCIKCNICVTACPVTAVTDLFPGPKYEAPQGARFRHDRQATPDHSVDYCSGCRVCNMVCPTGVRIAEINARARNDIVEEGDVPPLTRLRNNLLGRPELLGRLGQPVAPLANMLLHGKVGRFFASKMLGIAQNAPLPAFSRTTFSSWLKKHRSRGAASKKIVYFRGCSTEYYEPRVGRAAVHVLEQNGFEVLVPPQNCCGLPLLSNGEFNAARRYHESNVGKLVGYVKQGYVIVGTSTSCTLTLKEEAPELLDYYTADSRLLAANTFDLHEFLTLLHDAGELDTSSLRPVSLRLGYHAPCQFKAHRIGRPSAEIMALIPDLEIIESDVRCCGVAGTYGYKAEKYQISMDVGKPLVDFLQAVNGPVAVCDSETCRWQITHASGQDAIHPVELLAAAYGFPVEDPLAAALNH